MSDHYTDALRYLLRSQSCCTYCGSSLGPTPVSSTMGTFCSLGCSLAMAHDHVGARRRFVQSRVVEPEKPKQLPPP